MSRRRFAKRRPGFTLIELSFSITFYTSIALIGVLSFIGIFGVYTKAQSLTKTQAAARTAIDEVVRDLRTSNGVEFFANSAATDAVTSNANPILTPPATDTVTAGLAGKAIDYYCIESVNGDVGYSLLAVNSQYVLVRMPEGCNSFVGYQELAGDGLWSDIPTGVVGTAGKLEGTAFTGLSIKKYQNTSPPVWSVQVGIESGSHIPGQNDAGLASQFAAGTILQAVVTTRQ